MKLNREQRRRLGALARMAQAFPQAGADSLTQPGIIHAVYSHDSGCQTLRTGRGSDCNCNPSLTFHREPGA